MNNEAVREVLLQILQVGLLRARAAAFSGSADVCGHEVDHLHNLPKLALTLDQGELWYYFSAERRDFVEGAATPVDEFTPLWDRLGRLLGSV